MNVDTTGRPDVVITETCPTRTGNNTIHRSVGVNRRTGGVERCRKIPDGSVLLVTDRWYDATRRGSPAFYRSELAPLLNPCPAIARTTEQRAKQ